MQLPNWGFFDEGSVTKEAVSVPFWPKKGAKVPKTSAPLS